MANQLKKAVIKVSFDTLVDQLKAALAKEGFVISGITDFHREFTDILNVHFRKYMVLNVDLPHLSHQMLSIAPPEGVVLPCCITLAEHYPGEVEVIPVNPTSLIAKGMGSTTMLHMAEEVSRKLERVVHSLERNSTSIPDLVTSWD